MTSKQEAFVQEYLVDLCATQAAIRAGFSAKNADTIAIQLLRKTQVAHAIAAARIKQTERVQIKADDVIRWLVQIAAADVNEIVEYRRESCAKCWPDAEQDDYPREINRDCKSCRGDGVGVPFFKDTRYLSPAARALYEGVKVTKEGVEVKIASRDRARELLGKHLGLFTERIEVSGMGDCIVVLPDNLREERVIEADDANALPSPPAGG